MAAQKEFAIVPTQEELDSLQRDLRFIPVENSNPRVLTSEQISQYNRDGYIKDLRVFSEDEIVSIRGDFDALLGKVLAAGGDSYSISSAHLKYGAAYDLLTEPRIVELVRDLLGEDVIGWGSHYFCKMPHDGKTVAWHQDSSYWPLSHSRTVTVWLAIDDADQENACMRFLPGSHLAGHVAWKPSESTEGNVLNQTVDVGQDGEAVDDELRAGQLSMHSDLLLHGSEANDSDRRRCGLTLRYCSADVRAGLDWNHKGVVVSGHRSGHWLNPPRPTG